MNEPDKELFNLFQSLDVTPRVRETYLTSPFGWPGSKSRCIEQILPELPYRSRYAEPFGGSGKILLARNACEFEVLNDRHSGVTAFYRVVRDKSKCDLLIQRLEEVCYSREEFIWSRDTWQNCGDEVERAARWFYSIKCSFGSQGRNFGRSLTGHMMQKSYHNSLKLFPPCSLRLRNVLIENLDWRQIFKDFDHPDMVFYVDPPYYKVTKGMFLHEMPDADHIELLERIFHLKAFVALSSYPNDVYNKYPWDNMKSWEVKTTTLAKAFTDENNLAGMQDVMSRKDATECLYIKESS